MNNTEVFGNTFKDYNKEEMEGFIYPFKVRFALNGIDYKEVFKDKYCLDAGCGSGRGSLFMAEGGANEIKAIDISEQNIINLEKNKDLFGYDNIMGLRSSILNISYSDNTFDIVWCNGVAHHTGDTDKAIKELIRVLKPGGYLWLYVYGGGGLFWSIVFKLRKWVEGIEPEYAIRILKDNHFKTHEIGEIIDHLFCEYLHTYRYMDMYYFLSKNGIFSERQLQGMLYDTSMRRYLFGNVWKEEYRLMGEGDLRFWGRKKRNKMLTWSDELKEMEIDNSFLQAPINDAVEYCTGNWFVFNPNIERYKWDKVIISGRIIRHLKREMNKLLPFDMEEFKIYIDSLKDHWR